MSQRSSQYPQGHQESVIRMHSSRTAADCAAYLIPSLEPHMHILDVGCGPGSITADLAALVPEGHVVGLDQAADVLEKARAAAAKRGVKNIEFVTGNALVLDFADHTFDVVHAHQVVQYIDTVEALREMRRVTKPGGIVAVRVGQWSTMTWYPDFEGVSKWHDTQARLVRASGGDFEVGRRLVACARQAGFDRASITATTGSWCYSSPEERAWWGGTQADRVLHSDFPRLVIDGGYATQDDLNSMAQAWQDWAAEDDGWFGVLHSEILCRV